MEMVLVGFVALFALLFLQVPISFGMAIVGTFGFAYFVGLAPALRSIGTTATDMVMLYDFSVLPLFVLMGNFVARSGISQDLYEASNRWLGHRRGGLAMATIVACGGFSAVCGSSLATAATMAKVAMPPMRRFGYADSLAAGSIAAGGTLGILIPPSIALVIYGIMTETDIGHLFAAGIIPGILGIFLYTAAVAVVTRINPELGPPAEPAPWSERFRSLRGVWGMLVLFVIVMGGIYVGFFTPTEAAGIGATGAFVIALARKTLTVRSTMEILVESGRTTATLMTLLIGSLLFTNFVNVSRLPNVLADWFVTVDIPPLGVVVICVAIYIVLGCILESISMMLLTVPVFYPVMQTLGLDLVWFGIVVVVVIEISLITPPIGLNVFVLNAMLPDVKLTEIFRGVLPFVAADIVRVALIIFIPALSLYLPSFMD
ncbi:MAG: TRAP transporter large permease [Pseudomonadota bacterium]|nr:TRAP transporter large permease [Pseudomonadota bacterium]